MADGGIARLTDLVLAAAPGVDPTGLRVASDALVTATSATIVTAKAAYKSALAQIAAALGTDVTGLLVSAVAARMPDLPGLRDGLAGVIATLPVDGWRPDVPLGPAELGLDLPAALALPGDRPPASLGLLPPDGASIVIGAGPVQGGGVAKFTDQPYPRFTGAVGLQIGPVGVTAFAILEKPPGQDLSLLVLIGARFTPGIQFGFGFALSGVGGVVGVNRSVDTDALRRRMADGSATDALFPGSPTRDTPALLRSLGEFFPPQQGSFVAGPTLRLTFLEGLVSLDLGVVVELPAGRVVIVGRGEVSLPPVVPLVHLRLDVLGEIDPPRKLVAVTAMLVDSRALGIFRITGGATMQQCWGSPPFTVMSVGGFYPGFDPAPAIVPALDRVGLEPDVPLPGLTLSAKGYLAITSNTVQAGIDLRVGIDAVVLSAEGSLKVDAICQFKPFHFHADVSAGFEIDAFLFSGGATLSGSVDGPGPVVISGSISVDLLIDDLEWSDTFTIGKSVHQDVPTVPSVAAELARTILAANLHATGGADSEALLEPRPVREGQTLLLPRGTLTWQQQLAPLGTPLQRFQGRPLAGAPGRTSTVTATVPGATPAAAPRDWFAPGLYLERTGSEAIDMPPYDLLPSGVAVAFPLERGPLASESRAFEEHYKGLTQPTVASGWAGLVGLALQRADDRGGPSAVRDRTALVTAHQEKWGVRSTGPAQPTDSRTAAFVTARTSGKVALPIADAGVDASGVLV